LSLLNDDDDVDDDNRNNSSNLTSLTQRCWGRV